MSISLKAAAAALFTVVLWGSAFPGIEAGLEAYAPGQLALLRYLFASATMAAVALVRPVRVPRWRDVPGIVAMGALGFAVYHSALNYGQVSVTAGAASFLIETAPVFATVMAAAFLGERLSRLGWAGLLVSLGGAALIAFGEAGGLTGSLRMDPGALFVLLAALSGAGYFTLQKPFLRRYSSLELTAYALWTGTLLMGVWAPGLPEQMAAAPTSATLAVAYIGILPGALAYVTYAYVLKRLPVALATSLLYLVPLAALPIAWLWLGEVPPTAAVVGGLVTLAGVLLVQKGGTTEAPNAKREAPDAKKEGVGDAGVADTSVCREAASASTTPRRRETGRAHAPCSPSPEAREKGPEQAGRETLLSS